MHTSVSAAGRGRSSRGRGTRRKPRRACDLSSGVARRLALATDQTEASPDQMQPSPQLIDVQVPDNPAGTVLVLHGGSNRGESRMVSPTQLSVLRMLPVARGIARAAPDELAVFRLLNSVRGWDTTHTPVEDAKWALGEIAQRLGRRSPTCLVGHSLGGRGAVLAAGQPEVVSVAALAAWVYPDDVPKGLNGQQILFVHGSRDRIASPARSAALARNLSHHARVGYVTVEGGKHAMLRRHGVFSGLATQFATATLLGRWDDETISRIQDGETVLEV
jgi:predicted esterase